MPEVLPDEISLEWFLKNRRRVTSALNRAEKPTVVVGAEGQIAPGKTNPGSVNILHDLRIMETSAEPLPIAPPVLSLTVDEPDQELDLEWTIPQAFNELFLERSEDGATWTPLATLPGTQDAYEDADVTPGVREYYRIRGRVGGAYSAHSNVVNGMLEAGCEYALPDDMGSATLHFQGFGGSDSGDAILETGVGDGVPAGTPSGGFGGMAGNLFMSENGRTIIVSAPEGIAFATYVITREDDDSLTFDILNANGSVVPYRYVMSRNGIIAGKIDSQGAAVWLSGPTGSPTVDSLFGAWDRISPDGTKLYGRKTSGGIVTERTIGGADVTIATGGGAVCGLSHCCDVVICGVGDDTLRVYKLISGTWTHTATLADGAGDTEADLGCIGVSGDGTKAFGNNFSDEVPVFWDITGTGTINSQAMGLPAALTGQCFTTFIATSGNIVCGRFVGTGTGKSIYWLASEGFATAHRLDDYLTAQGLTELGSSFGQYRSNTNTVCSADGTQFAAVGTKENSPGFDYLTLYFAACPAPT